MKMNVQYPQIPTFAPEHFARVSQVNTLKRKQFVKGVEELAQEGAIQVFQEAGTGMESVIVGVVGVLQLDVLERRLQGGVPRGRAPPASCRTRTCAGF